jgi:glyoxylate reductase
LYKLANCVIAPHIASATVQTRNEMARICAENVIGGATGGKLTALVNPEVEAKRRK